MNVTIVGAGYVGFSLAVLLSELYNVTIVDTNEDKVDLINQHISPIQDKEIEDILYNRNIKATTDSRYLNQDFIIVAVPTNLDEVTNAFDISIVDKVIDDIYKKTSKSKKKSTIVIKSTLPIGHTRILQTKYKNINILCSPEFLRETKSLYDNLYPSRIIVGMTNSKQQKVASEFGWLLLSCAIKKNTPVYYTTSDEAEAIKLFSNSYLAMRVAFFNELDSFAEVNHLNTKRIIDAMCEDPRINKQYNNPSFGYGGYCLPKDTRQLLSHFNQLDVPNDIFDAIVKSNETRKQYIINKVSKKKVVGIYRLQMKSNSDNYRWSAILDIISRLDNKRILIYEPLLKEEDIDGLHLMNIEVINDLNIFKFESEIILANRYDKELNDVKEKVYTRDVYNEN